MSDLTADTNTDRALAPDVCAPDLTTVAVRDKYSDDSEDLVEDPVTVYEKSPSIDANKYTPIGKDKTVNVGETPDAKDSITNLPDLPEGTKVEFKDPVDTTTPGEKDVVVVVTYPDGSTDEVIVKITVTEPSKPEVPATPDNTNKDNTGKQSGKDNLAKAATLPNTG